MNIVLVVLLIVLVAVGHLSIGFHRPLTLWRLTLIIHRYICNNFSINANARLSASVEYEYAFV